MEINRIDIRKEFASVYHLLIQSNGRCIYSYATPEPGLLSYPQAQELIKNIWENYPFKSLVFNQQLDGTLVADERTAEILYIIKTYMDDGVIVYDMKYSKMPSRSYFEDYIFDTIVIKPSDKLTDVARLQQF